jgi:acetyl-CoA carboxylase, biotin carboxylase subunit
MFKRILIANRGEVALRTLRACHELGIEAICVYSEEDRGTPYLDFADRAICIGGPSPKDSYLKSDRIIAAAEVANADAIHPGYGFLAENAAFADKCRESSVEFIGPSSDAMRLLGDKASALELAKKSKVPTIPGSDGPVETAADAHATAKKLGFPVMLKAVAGGGGRGMRIVRDRDQLDEQFAQAQLEAKTAFNDESLYLEKFLEHPRHVEIQMLADNQGHVVHLFERDCSVQRRYQKLIEESPSPGLDSKTRSDLCKAAVKLCKAGKYSSAGTFEFLVVGKREYYFIEANTRIQVEHPVTEMVTGIDLIKEQIRIAAGESLTFSQKDVKQRGHAIECRINAEDPEHGFRPSAGVIKRFRQPGGFGVRVDTHAHDGYRVSPRYDSLVAKLIVHQPTRDEAIDCMLRCLNEFVIEPTKTTIPIHQRVLRMDAFRSGEIDTGFVDRQLTQTKSA